MIGTNDSKNVKLIFMMQRLMPLKTKSQFRYKACIRVCQFWKHGSPGENQSEKWTGQNFRLPGLEHGCVWSRRFILKDAGINDEELNKTNISDLLTTHKRKTGSFSPFVMMVHL